MGEVPFWESQEQVSKNIFSCPKGFLQILANIAHFQEESTLTFVSLMRT